jgi:hypothetical protein
MSKGDRTGRVLLVLAMMFVGLGLKFASGFGARPPAPRKIPLVDPQFLDTATIRKSYAELIRTNADLSDFDCYVCHERQNHRRCGSTRSTISSSPRNIRTL